MKKIIAVIKENKKLIIILLLCSFISFALGFCFDNKFGDFFINLSASFVIIIFTIFIVDKLLKEREIRKYKEAYNIAKDDLLSLRNMLISHMSEPLGFVVGSGGVKNATNELLKILKKVSEIDLEEKLKGMTIKDWEHLQINLPFIRMSLSYKINLYSNLIPIDVLGKLLAVNKEFESFYMMFGFLPGLFVKEQKYWPIKKGRLENGKIIRGQIINKMSQDLKNYYCAVDEFSNLDYWKK